MLSLIVNENYDFKTANANANTQKDLGRARTPMAGNSNPGETKPTKVLLSNMSQDSAQSLSAILQNAFAPK
jgi:hypothetical protein